MEFLWRQLGLLKSLWVFESKPNQMRRGAGIHQRPLSVACLIDEASSNSCSKFLSWRRLVSSPLRFSFHDVMNTFYLSSLPAASQRTAAVWAEAAGSIQLKTKMRQKPTFLSFDGQLRLTETSRRPADFMGCSERWGTAHSRPQMLLLMKEKGKYWMFLRSLLCKTRSEFLFPQCFIFSTKWKRAVFTPPWFFSCSALMLFIFSVFICAALHSFVPLCRVLVPAVLTPSTSAFLPQHFKFHAVV